MITFEVISFPEIMGLSSEERINKIVNLAKSGKIALIQGRLPKEEELELVKKAMSYVNNEFKGIELAVIEPQNSENGFMYKIRLKLIQLFGGGLSQGITLVGPATLIKEVKNNPNKLQLIVSDSKKKRVK